MDHFYTKCDAEMSRDSPDEHLCGPQETCMSLWQQNYDPAGNIWLSSLIASLPILFFFFALIKLKLKGYLAATYTVAIALLVALFFYKM